MNVGIDVGGTFLKAVAVDDDVLDQGRRMVPETGVLDFVAEVGAELISTYGATALGVGVAGLVRWPSGEFVWGPHVSGRAVAYKAELESRLGVPVVVDNDANLAALAEARRGAAVGAKVVLMLTFGTGIGAGLVIDGNVYHGVSFAGEVGHVTMLPGGALCACGRRGCWETLVSGSRLDQIAAELVSRAPEGEVARRAVGRVATGAELTAAADAGDAAAQAAVAEVGVWLGRGVANLVAVLDPEVIVVGGAAAQAGHWLLDPAREAIASHLAGSHYRAPVLLVPARFGPLAGAVGAALAAGDIE